MIALLTSLLLATAPPGVHAQPKILTSAAEVDAACEARLKAADALRERLLAVAGPRTRRNTLEPYDRLGFELDAAFSQAGHYAGVHPDAGVRAAAERCVTTAQARRAAIALEPALFAALEAVAPGPLAPDARRFRELTLASLRNAGVGLDAAGRADVARLQAELAAVDLDFRRPLVAPLPPLLVDPRTELGGLSEELVRTLPREKDGRVRIEIRGAEATTILRDSTNPALRRALWLALESRGSPDNLPNLVRLLESRHALARRLGFPHWVARTGGRLMSGPTEAISGFIDRIDLLARPIAQRELDVALALKRLEEPGATQLQGWDESHYLSRGRSQRFDFDLTSVKPYFETKAVADGVLAFYARLFGLEFRPLPSVRGWHPSVRFFEVWRGQRCLGRLFLDLYERPDKLRINSLSVEIPGGGGGELPSAGLVTSFPDPTDPARPSLLEHRRVVTVFHELGHFLDLVASADQPFSRFANGAEEGDVGEVTSQLMETWAHDPDVLAGFARHHETGAPIPRATVERLRASGAFGRGVGAREYVFWSAMVVGLQSRDPAGVDLAALVKGVHERYACHPWVDGEAPHLYLLQLLYPSTLFHTYLWSRVIAEDLAGRFRAAGLGNRGTARAYWELVLAPGGSRPMREKLRAFLGREPDEAGWVVWLGGATPREPAAP